EADASTNTAEAAEVPHDAIRAIFKLVCGAKLKSTQDYIGYLLDGLNSKVLFFAHHRVMLDAIEQTLRSRKVGFVRIDGQVPQQLRPKLIQDFQEDPSVTCAVLSITACGEGLNLTAASTVVFCELYWVPGIMEQCEARAHRMGQKSMVDVHYIVVEGSVDERAYASLARKKEAMGAILDGKVIAFQPDATVKNDAAFEGTAEERAQELVQLRVKQTQERENKREQAMDERRLQRDKAAEAHKSMQQEAALLRKAAKVEQASKVEQAKVEQASLRTAAKVEQASMRQEAALLLKAAKVEQASATRDAAATATKLKRQEAASLSKAAKVEQASDTPAAPPDDSEPARSRKRLRQVSASSTKAAEVEQALCTAAPPDDSGPSASRKRLRVSRLLRDAAATGTNSKRQAPASSSKVAKGEQASDTPAPPDDGGPAASRKRLRAKTAAAS
ncbi:unnamed protein product, partial [Polarella glacialis]